MSGLSDYIDHEAYGVVPKESLEAAEAEVKRLREALAQVRDWDGTAAKAHGHIGVREFARDALEKERT